MYPHASQSYGALIPRAEAVAVAAYARKIMNGDKSGRHDLCKSMKMKEDASVKD